MKDSIRMDPFLKFSARQGASCGCGLLSSPWWLALHWEMNHPTVCNPEEPADPTPFCSRDSLMSPVVGPEEPLCLVARQDGWVLPASRESGPAHQPARVHAHLAGGAEGRPAQSQLATSHMLGPKCLAPVPCGCVSPGQLLVRREVTGVRKPPLSYTWGCCCQNSVKLKGYKEKRDPGSCLRSYLS